jgi:hypothetical protein
MNGCFLFNGLTIVRAVVVDCGSAALRWVSKNIDANTDTLIADAILPRRRNQFLNLILILPTELTGRFSYLSATDDLVSHCTGNGSGSPRKR